MNYAADFKSIKESLVNVGDALRELNNSSDTYSFSQFADAIRSGKQVAYDEGYEAGVKFLSDSVSAVSIGTSYTCPHDGFIVYKAYATVTNHDNSYKMDASIVSQINGSTHKSTSTHIDSWSGGRMTLEGTIKVSKGDTFTCSINVANSQSIGWSTSYMGTYFNTSVD